MRRRLIVSSPTLIVVMQPQASTFGYRDRSRDAPWRVCLKEAISERRVLHASLTCIVSEDVTQRRFISRFLPTRHPYRLILGKSFSRGHWAQAYSVERSV